MADYKVQIKASASKELAKLEVDIGVRVSEAIETLSTKPRPTQCKKLKGGEDSYRLRVAKIRIIYQIDDSKKIVTVYKIGHRRDVYREL